MSTSHAVIVVGAGFSGIGMAARMKEMGIDDFVVLDRGNDLGGTWRDNAYPGAACDVPSNLYSYSFALNPEWTSSFPSQGEIWDYIRGCEERFEIGDHLRFSLTIDEARFDEGAKEWVVRAKSGETYPRPGADLGDRVLVGALDSGLPGPRAVRGPGLCTRRAGTIRSTCAPNAVLCGGDRGLRGPVRPPDPTGRRTALFVPAHPAVGVPAKRQGCFPLAQAPLPSIPPAPEDVSPADLLDLRVVVGGLHG